MWVESDDCGLVAFNVVLVVFNVGLTVISVAFNLVSKLSGIAGRSNYDCGPLHIGVRDKHQVIEEPCEINVSCTVL